VIEIDRQGRIVWQFGVGPHDFSPNSILGPNDAERIDNLTLMAGSGIPPGVDPAAPHGAVDNRVILVNRRGAIVWQYGEFGVTGSGPNELNTPVYTTALSNKNILITDQGNARVIEVTRAKEIVWQYGMTGVAGSGPNQLNNISKKGRILAQYGNLNQPGFGHVSAAQGLNWPYDAKVIGNFFGLTPPESGGDDD
jgi:hypothetical protein